MVQHSPWEGDYEQRLTDQLRARGCASATAYVSERPTESLRTLAGELGHAAVQLEKRLYAEAIASNTVERFARDLLVRHLHAGIPEGWHRDWGPDIPGDLTTVSWRQGRAISAWSTAIGMRPEYDALSQRMMLALRDESPFPDGWLPANADDPMLVEFFRARLSPLQG